MSIFIPYMKSCNSFELNDLRTLLDENQDLIEKNLLNDLVNVLGELDNRVKTVEEEKFEMEEFVGDLKSEIEDMLEPLLGFDDIDELKSDLRIFIKEKYRDLKKFD